MHLILAQFVSWGLAGAAFAAGAIPIVIHLLNRQRFKRVTWAAMDFLLAASRKNARRIKFEHWLLLTVRTLAILLACLAIARPFLPDSASAALLGRPSAVHLLVVDGSLSMQQPGPTAGQTAWQGAVVQAEKMLEKIPPTDQVGLLVAGEITHLAAAPPTLNHEQIRRQLRELACGFAGADWPNVFPAITKLLDESKAVNRRVYLFTDLCGPYFQPGNPASATLADAVRTLGTQTGLTVVDWGGTNTQNVAVTDISAVSPLVAVGMPTEVRITLRNFGRREQSGLTTRLKVNGQYAATAAAAPLAGGALQTVLARLVLEKPGPARVEVSLSGLNDDALPPDNSRFLILNARDKVNVLLVDGQPSSRPMAGAAGYLRVALAPRAEPNQPTLIEPKTITDLELPAETLSHYAAVYLANVRQLEPKEWQRLADYARNGGAVILFMGNQVNLEHYNRLAFADGTGVLPLQLDRLMEADPANTAQVGYWTFQLADVNHPIVSDFGQHRTGGLFTARVMRYLKPLPLPAHQTQPATPHTQQAIPVLSLSDGSPALVIRPLGKGYTALFTSAANLSAGDQLWTNLPAKMDWVVLQHNLLAGLLPREAAERNLLVGQAITLPLPPNDTLPPIVTGPEGAALPVKLHRESPPPAGNGKEKTSPTIVAEVNDTRLPGFYRCDLRPQEVWFAANVDTEDSDLTHATEAQLRTLWGGNFKYVKGLQSTVPVLQEESASREIGLTLLTIALALLLAETFLAQRFGHHAG